MKRRNFIKTAALASTAALSPAFLRGSSFGRLLNSRSGKTLVVIQLSGGNDGLNTIIPYRNDLYYQNRPSIGIPVNDVLRVSDELGFHPSLAPLRKWYDQGLMSIINNVGYPNPSRSHFRSMDIWQTASGSSDYWSTGWLGRYLDSECGSDCSVLHAMDVDYGLSIALRGAERSGFAMNKPQDLRNATKNPFLESIAPIGHDHKEENVAYLYKTLTDTQEAADYLFEKSRVHRSRISYPKGGFAKDLRQVAELMTADTDTRIYYVSLGGFDTHYSQKGKQAQLLKEYAAGVSAFLEDLEHNNLLDDTLVMTFSEFGRRVAQNGSNGTDHGTANNLYLMSGELRKPGFYNDGPNLSQLVNEDLAYEIDFRRIYATIIEKWLNGDASEVLRGRFAAMDLV
ncbi:MAG: DUF1501 domain-containing protein [Bacteroidota bacterium]